MQSYNFNPKGQNNSRPQFYICPTELQSLSQEPISRWLFLALVAIHHEKTWDLRYLAQAQPMNNTAHRFNLFSLLCSAIGQPLLSSPVNHPINLRGKGGTDGQLTFSVFCWLTLRHRALAFFSFNGIKIFSSFFKVCSEEKKIRNCTRWTFVLISDYNHVVLFRCHTWMILVYAWINWEECLFLPLSIWRIFN